MSGGGGGGDQGQLVAGSPTTKFQEKKKNLTEGPPEDKGTVQSWGWGKGRTEEVRLAETGGGDDARQDYVGKFGKNLGDGRRGSRKGGEIGLLLYSKEPAFEQSSGFGFQRWEGGG